MSKNDPELTSPMPRSSRSSSGSRHSHRFVRCSDSATACTAPWSGSLCGPQPPTRAAVGPGDL